MTIDRQSQNCRDSNLDSNPMVKFSVNPISGMSPSGKAPGSGPGIRGFESLHPSHEKSSDLLVWRFSWLECFELPSGIRWAKSAGETLRQLFHCHKRKSRLITSRVSFTFGWRMTVGCRRLIAVSADRIRCRFPIARES